MEMVADREFKVPVLRSCSHPPAANRILHISPSAASEPTKRPAHPSRAASPSAPPSSRPSARWNVTSPARSTASSCAARKRSTQPTSPPDTQKGVQGSRDVPLAPAVDRMADFFSEAFRQAVHGPEHGPVPDPGAERRRPASSGRCCATIDGGAEAIHPVFTYPKRIGRTGPRHVPLRTRRRSGPDLARHPETRTTVYGCRSITPISVARLPA